MDGRQMLLWARKPRPYKIGSVCSTYLQYTVTLDLGGFCYDRSTPLIVPF
jgi:hypothetical protein